MSKKQYILWGVLQGKPDWQEEILLTTYKPEDIEKVKPLATEKGYHKFRVTTFEFGKDFPDFSDPKLINI